MSVSDLQMLSLHLHAQLALMVLLHDALTQFTIFDQIADEQTCFVATANIGTSEIWIETNDALDGVEVVEMTAVAIAAGLK